MKQCRCLINQKITLIFIVVFVLSPEIVFGKNEIIVSAASSLTNVMKALGKRYEIENVGTKIVFNFASSGALLRQIENGAPVDVFASANVKFMNDAIKYGLVIKESKTEFAQNVLVLAAHVSLEPAEPNPQIIGDENVKFISIGSPRSVPAGRYAAQALRSYKLWNEVSNKVVYGNSVRQVLDYIVRQEVDYGVIYATDIFSGRGQVKVVCELVGHDPILYPVAVIKESRNIEEAKHFIEFLNNSKGQLVLRKYGFKLPE